MKKVVTKVLRSFPMGNFPIGFLLFIFPALLLLQGCPSPTAVTPASVRPAPQLPEPETGPPVTDADGKTIGTTTLQKDAQGSIIGKSLQVSDSVTAINAFAFSSRGFTSVTIPPGVTSIAPRAFAGNPDLKSVTISQELLNTTNPNAFPGGATFKDAAGRVITSILKNEPAESDVEGSKTTVTTDGSGNTVFKSLEVSPRLTTIPASKFADLGLTSVVVPPLVKGIDPRAFTGSPDLASVTISQALLNTTDNAAFPGKTVFTSHEGKVITRWKALLPTTDRDGSVTTVTRDKDGTGKVVSKSLKVSSTLTTIPAAKFADQGLTSVSLSPETTTIANRAFADNRLTYLPIVPAAASISPRSTPGSPNLNQVFLSSVNFNQSAADTTSNSLIIPPTVTSIGPQAFAGNPNLKSVTISQELLNTTPSNAFPPGVTFRSTAGNVIASTSNNQTTIDAEGSIITVITKADGTVVSKTLMISPTLRIISNSKFAGQGLTAVIIPSHLAIIGSKAFMNNRLTEVTIPRSVIQIGSQAFMNNRLISITIPSSVMFIGKGAFSGNTGLKSVKIPQTLLNRTPADAFPTGIDFKDHNGDMIVRGGTTERTPGPDGFFTIVVKDAGKGVLSKTLEIASSVTSITDGAYVQGKWQGLFANKEFTDINVISPESLRSIGSYAFRNNSLTTVTIPNSVNSIKDYAFGGNRITTLTIPNSVTSLSGFDNNQLTALTIPNSVTSIGISAFENNRLTSVTIPNSVTSIGESAFSGNSLTSVIIPNSVNSIGDSAFRANRLTSVTIPNSVTSIGESAFSGNSLTSVIIPNSVNSIGDSAFRANRLTSVTIPTSVTSIGKSAFAQNPDLTSVTISQTLLNSAPVDAFPSSVTFRDHNGNVIIQGPITTERTPGPNGFATIIVKDARNRIISKTLEIGPSVVSIANRLFTNKEFTDIHFISPSSLRNIGSNAFSDNKLTSVNIPNSVTHIGDSAFSNNRLTSVTIPNSVTKVWFNAFMNNRLTSVTIPNSVIIIERYTFRDNRLTSVTIPDSVTSIGYVAFMNNNLTSVNIPSSVRTIGDGAFMNNSLTSVTIPNSVTSIGGSAFSNNNLTTVTIPTSVGSIRGYAFSGNTGLTSVTISQTLLNNTYSNVFPSGVIFKDHSGAVITRQRRR